METIGLEPITCKCKLHILTYYNYDPLNFFLYIKVFFIMYRKFVRQNVLAYKFSIHYKKNFYVKKKAINSNGRIFRLHRKSYWFESKYCLKVNIYENK